MAKGQEIEGADKWQISGNSVVFFASFREALAKLRDKNALQGYECRNAPLRCTRLGRTENVASAQALPKGTVGNRKR